MTTITLETAKAHGLTEQEWELINSTLGRTPTLTELGIYSAMWSEHCSYKSSKPLLARLPKEGRQVVQGPGENAGVVQVAPGVAVSFKVESHNHPSYVEPHQGAATGVGGILRDIIVMGARPIALLDSLHFGPPEDDKSRWVASGVIGGISAYGNCIGVPTVGGEVHFDECYRLNPLVNVMAIGLVGPHGVKKGIAKGAGNPVIAFGARTGRDGIHGAAFASAELHESSHEDRPSVQVGDPFTGKLLLEACQELFGLEGLVGIQDMGAAGLTSSTCEMAMRGDAGLRMDLDRLPLREAGMSAYEIMLSESQERMVAIMRRGTEHDAIRVLERWGLAWAVIGEVTEDGHVEILRHGKVQARIPTRSLTDECPLAPRKKRKPRYIARVNKPVAVEHPRALEAARKVLRSPELSSRREVYEQYDHKVGINTLVRPGQADAAVLRIKGHDVSIAATTDVNARACYLDPREGARQSVAEAARNLACVGARPMGMTDGLNFANPEDPEVYWQFAEVIEGIREAGLGLGIPVTGGNVSFYNQTGKSRVHPTPVIGMVGVLERHDAYAKYAFGADGEAVLLLGDLSEELGGSEYLLKVHGQLAGPLPRVDFAREQALGEVLRSGIAQGWVRTAHDISSGGLVSALAEMCLGSERPLGVRLEALPGVREPVAALFSEAPGRAVIAVDPRRTAEVEALAAQHALPVTRLGTVGGGALEVAGLLEISLDELAYLANRSFLGTGGVA